MDREQWSSFGLGILAGAIVGGAIALLYAPKTGKETREFLKSKAHQMRHNMGEKISGEACARNE